VSDIFSRLAALARDIAPRARPQLPPRYPNRAPPPVEDVEVETPYVPARSSPPRKQAVLDPWPPLARENATPRAEPPPLPQAPAAPSVAPREEIERASTEPLRPPISIGERTPERHVESRFEHTHIIERPPAAAPPPMRAPDVAALRLPEGKRAEIEAPARFARNASAARSQETDESASEAVHVSIGRIEVRAVSAPPPPAPRERPKPTPMGLDEYLRRRNEAS
jgi:hypothetical protein